MNPQRLIYFFVVLLFIGCSHPQRMLDAQDEYLYGSSREISEKAQQITRGQESPEGKARALYDWITGNIAFHESPSTEEEAKVDQSARSVFERKAADSTGYSNLFRAMAGAVGVQAERVHGFVKPRQIVGSRPAELKEGDWNAFQDSDGAWKMLDASWGAGYCTEVGDFVASPSTSWFSVPLEHLLVTHYPKKKKWRAGFEAVTEQQFAEFPQVNYEFERQGLALKPSAGYGKAVPEEFILELINPREAVLEAEVWTIGEDIGRLANATKVESGEGRSLIHFYLPGPGEYKLAVLSRLPDQLQFRTVCTHLAVCDSGAVQRDIPKPVPVAKRSKPKLDVPLKPISKKAQPEPKEPTKPAAIAKVEKAPKPARRPAPSVNPSVSSSNPRRYPKSGGVVPAGKGNLGRRVYLAAPPALSNTPVDPEVAKKAKEVTRGARTDRDKAYAIYRYIAENLTYDCDYLFSGGKYRDQSAATALRTKVAVCAGYSHLFRDMATAVGLEAEYITGFSNKGPFESRAKGFNIGHAWNSVKLDGRWELVDTTWGGGSVNNQTRKFVHEPNDDWFCPPPGNFAYSHRPDDDHWQLLANPVSEKEFRQLPSLSARFFKSGLSLRDPRKGLFDCQGSFEIGVFNSQDRIISAGVYDTTGNRIPQSTLVERKGREMNIKARFARKGLYRLVFFVGKESDQGIGLESVGHIYVKSKVGSDAVFPEFYAPFISGGAKILKGEDGQLDAGKSVTLSFQIPDAKEVIIVNGTQKVDMDKRGDVFTATFTPVSGEAIVQMGMGGGAYSRLARYEAI